MGRDGRPVSPISHTIRPTFGRGVGLFFYILLPKNRFYLHPSTWGKACVNTLSHTVMYKRLYPNHRAFFTWCQSKKPVCQVAQCGRLTPLIRAILCSVHTHPPWDTFKPESTKQRTATSTSAKIPCMRSIGHSKNSHAGSAVRQLKRNLITWQIDSRRSKT